jgi:hypothetical protein
VASGATVYTGVPVQDPNHADIFNIASFDNDPPAGKKQALRADAALANPLRSLRIRPLDIIDWHNGRYYLQIVRNETMPKSFQYVTPLVAAKDRVLPLIDNPDADVDLSKLSSIIYQQPGPPAGSFGDVLARLYYALLTGKLDPHPPTSPGGMRTEIALSYPLVPGAPSRNALPDVRVPIVLQLLASGFTFYPSADEAWTMAQPIAAQVTSWLATNIGGSRPGLAKVAKLDVALTVFSAVSETSLPMIHLDGLYVNLRDLTG